MLLFELFDEHPNSLVRINDQIRLLEYELKNNTIGPKMKKAIQNDILACKKEIEFITNMSPENKHIVRIAYHKILKKYFNSRDIKDYLFDDKSKFSAY